MKGRGQDSGTEIRHGMVTDGHLGGYVPGGDAAAVYPHLWAWLVEEQGVRSVLDVGCGDGVAVAFFENLGCEVIGIDGIEQERSNIIYHDYTLGELRTHPKSRFDLCWSCEFVEHVEEQFVPNFLATFACADLVLMTHALPNQNGWHHVNCQPPEYWVEKLAGIGYDLDEELTADARNRASMNPHPDNYFHRTGLAFRRAA